MPKSNHEVRLHVVLLGYLRAVLPTEAARTLFHPANGENRSLKTGALLKRLGVRPGVSDLIFVWGGVIHCIEVKVEADPLRRIRRSYQSPEQRAFQADIEAAGGRYAVCRSTDDARASLERWDVPLKISDSSVRRME